MAKTMRNSQQGYISISLLLVVIAVLTLSAAALSRIGDVTTDMDNDNLKRDTEQLRNDIKRIFFSRPNFTGLSREVLEDFDVIPASFKGFSGPGGASVSIAPDGANNRFFVITFDNFKDVDAARTSCFTLIPAASSNWDAFIIDGQSFSQGSFTDASSACASASSMALRGQ